MKLTLAGLRDYDFLQKEHEYNAFGGNGGNLSPALNWDNAPAEAKSFAVTVYDPDAPTGSGFWHWVAYDIPAPHRSLAAGAGTPGNNDIQHAQSDFGQAGYGGCCPPEGDVAHRYIFTLHALGCEKLGVGSGMPNAVVRFMIQMNTIQTASVITLYKR